MEGGRAALIIVNWEYRGFENLQFPENDGILIKDMFDNAKFNTVKVIANSEDILQDINASIEDVKDETFELFHFHYSGHGVYHNSIEVNMDSYTKEYEGDMFNVNYKTHNDAPSGDCMVGTRGELCPVELVKRRLLNMTCERWTMTVDMCRGHSMRDMQRKKEKSHVTLPYLEPIPQNKEGSIA